MPDLKALDMPSWLKAILIKRQSQNGKHTPPWRLAQNLSPPRNSNCPYTPNFFGSLRGISCVCTHPVGSTKANNCSDRWTIRHTFFPDEGNPASTVECMWLCAAIKFQNSRHCRLSQHCGWLFLQTVTQSHREETPQNPGKSPNNKYRSDHILLGWRWWRTFSLHTSRQKGLVRRAKQSLERKEPCRQNAKQWVANEEPPSLKTSLKEF